MTYRFASRCRVRHVCALAESCDGVWNSREDRGGQMDAVAVTAERDSKIDELMRQCGPVPIWSC